MAGKLVTTTGAVTIPIFTNSVWSHEGFLVFVAATFVRALGSLWTAGSRRGNIFSTLFLSSPWLAGSHYGNMFPGSFWDPCQLLDRRVAARFVLTISWAPVARRGSISPSYFWGHHGLLDLVATRSSLAFLGHLWVVGSGRSSFCFWEFLASPWAAGSRRGKNCRSYFWCPYGLLKLVAATFLLAISGSVCAAGSRHGSLSKYWIASRQLFLRLVISGTPLWAGGSRHGNSFP